MSVSPSGEVEEGQSVVLSCRSQANPPAHTYTWYKKRGPESVLKMVAEELNLTLTSSDEGLYHCEAHNEVGSQNSSVTEVDFAGTLFFWGGNYLSCFVLGVVCDSGDRLLIFEVDSQSNYTLPFRAPESSVFISWNRVWLGP